jgi:hypothetical protein
MEFFNCECFIFNREYETKTKNVTNLIEKIEAWENLC